MTLAVSTSPTFTTGVVSSPEMLVYAPLKYLTMDNFPALPVVP